MYIEISTLQNETPETLLKYSTMIYQSIYKNLVNSR